MKKRVLILFTTLFLLTGCGNSYSADMAMNAPMKEEAYATSDSAAGYSSYSNDIYEEAYDDVAEMKTNGDYEYDEEVANKSKKSLENRKLITTMNMGVETENFDELIAVVEKKVDDLGGYIENSNFYSNYNKRKNADYVIRVPEVNLPAFTGMISDNANVISKNTSVEDVTLAYVDIESRKAVYQTEEKRLLEMLSESTDVETLLNIEMRLSEVQADIESMEATLRSYDNKCSYSTIYINIKEVEVYTPVETKELTAWEKISQGFVKSLKNVGIAIRDFFIWFLINIPYLVFYAVVIVIIVSIAKLIIKLIKKSSEKKKAKKQAKEQAKKQEKEQAKIEEQKKEE